MIKIDTLRLGGSPLMTVRDLSEGERLLVNRRRQGRSQEQEAARRGVSVKTYAAWETGRDDAPLQPLARLLAHEACFVARRRCRWSQQQVAEALGCCRWWVVKMEQGLAPCHALADFWFS